MLCYYYRKYKPSMLKLYFWKIWKLRTSLTFLISNIFFFWYITKIGFMGKLKSVLRYVCSSLIFLFYDSTLIFTSAPTMTSNIFFFLSNWNSSFELADAWIWSAYLYKYRISVSSWSTSCSYRKSYWLLQDSLPHSSRMEGYPLFQCFGNCSWQMTSDMLPHNSY